MNKFKVIAIAQIVDNRESLIGFRLLNTDGKSGQYKDIPLQALISALTSHSIQVDNLSAINGQIAGTQGSIERLPKIQRTQSGYILLSAKENKNPLTIINKLGDEGYTVANYLGAIKPMRTDETVAYSKTYGISNGKVVTKNGIEFISAINGAYDEVELKKVNTSKIRARDVVDNAEGLVTKGGLTRATNLSGIVKSVNSQVSEEIEYNDTFNLLSKEQREIIQSYYVWWSVKTFESLAGSRKLEVTPKKALELAKIKRDMSWSYAGSKLAILYSKTGFDYCTLGHKLYKVHFAKGIDTDGNTEIVKFGSTCVADFFNISEKGVRELDKVTSIMSEEIEKLTDIARKDTWKNAWDDVKIMDEVVSKLETPDRCKEIFGERLGDYLYRFKICGLPFPASLLRLSREYANRNTKVRDFWLKLYNNAVTLESLFKKYDSMDARERYGYLYIRQGNELIYKFVNILEHIYTVRLEGIYSYDPIKKIGERGKGRFTKEAVVARQGFNRECRARYGIEKFSLIEVEKCLKAFNLLFMAADRLDSIKTQLIGSLVNENYIVNGTKNAEDRIKEYEELIMDSLMQIFKYNSLISRNCNIDEKSAEIILKSLVINVKGYHTYRDRIFKTLKFKEEALSTSTLSMDETINILRDCITNGRYASYYKEELEKFIERDKEIYGERERLKQKEKEEQERAQEEQERAQEEFRRKLEEQEEQKKLEEEQELEKERQKQKEEERQKQLENETLDKQKEQKEDAILTKLFEMDKSEGAICLNEKCQYNSDGSCKILMSLGNVDGVRFDEHNIVRVCNMKDDIKTQYEKTEKELVEQSEREISSLDKLQKLRLLYSNLDDNGIKLEEGSRTFIARDITAKTNKYKINGDLSYKQSAIIENELYRLEDELKKLGVRFSYSTGKFIESETSDILSNPKEYIENKISTIEIIKDNHRMGDTSDGENRTYKLYDYKDIKDKLNKIVTALDNDGVELASKTTSIIKTVITRGHFSDKQYKYIEEAIKALENK